MRALWLNAKKDILRRLHDPLALVLWLLIPVAILTLLVLAFGQQTTPTVKLLVADNDDTFVSNFVLGAFGQGQMAEMFEAQEVTEEEGRALLDDGEASALLVIPEGFSAAVLEGESATIELVKNPAQTILPEIAEEVVSVLVDAAYYLRELLGDELGTLTGGAAPGKNVLPDTTVAAFSVTVNQLMERVSKYALPPVIEVTIEKVEDKPEESATKPGWKAETLGQLFFPSMLFMSLLFITQSLSADLWTEHGSGTLRRATAAPHSLLVFLGGKLLGGAILCAAIAAGATLCGVFIFDVSGRYALLAILWGGLAGSCMHAIFMLLQALASSERAGSILTSLVAFPLMLAGGTFFPFEAMPDFLATIGRLTPNGWALEQYKAILAGALDLPAFLLTLGGLLLVGGLCLALTARRVRRALVGA